MSQILSSDNYQQGIDRTIWDKPFKCPGTKLVQIKFPRRFQNIPEVSVSYSSLKFPVKYLNHYTTDVQNITEEGFQVEYKCNQDHFTFNGELQWFAFDNEEFGEVIYFEENSTDALATFFTHGDEHRLYQKPRTYKKPPQLAIFVIGVQNEGPEWIFSANRTSVTTTGFQFYAFAWHHSNVDYFKVTILAFDSDTCDITLGSKYVWDELVHKWLNHTWNFIPNTKLDRFDTFETKLTKGQLSGDYFFYGINGYDVKKGDFNLEIRNQQIAQKNIMTHEVGTRNTTKLAGAWWFVMVCKVYTKQFLQDPAKGDHQKITDSTHEDSIERDQLFYPIFGSNLLIIVLLAVMVVVPCYFYIFQNKPKLD